MADRIEEFKVTVPRGVAASKYVSGSLTFREGIVRAVQIVVPSGPSGFSGLRLTEAKQPLIPYTDGSWIITDDEKIDWPLSNAIQSGDWGYQAYNEDVYQHSYYIRFLVDETGEAPAAALPPSFAPAAPASIGEIEAAGGGEAGEPEPPPESTGEPAPEGEPTPEGEPAPEPGAEAPPDLGAPPEAEAPEAEAPEPPEAPEPGSEGEVSATDPKTTPTGWVAAAFWHGKGRHRRLWWFYGSADDAERYRVAHHLHWAFYGTLAQGRSWLHKHVPAHHRPAAGQVARKPAAHRGHSRATASASRAEATGPRKGARPADGRKAGGHPREGQGHHEPPSKERHTPRQDKSPPREEHHRPEPPPAVGQARPAPPPPPPHRDDRPRKHHR